MKALFPIIVGSYCAAGMGKAEGLVLVLNKESGSFEARQQAQSFARSFGPGGLPLGIEPKEIERKSPELGSVSIPAPRVPRAEIDAAITETALRYGGHSGLRSAGLSVTEWLTLFRANIEIESGYNQSAVSRTGAIGLGQLMPGTAAVLGVDPHNMHQNLDGSARYLLMLLDRFGSKELALAGYNAGPEAVTKYGGIPPYAETQGHVRKVMAVFQRLTVAMNED